MGSNKNRWNLEKMQDYCDNLHNDYKILDIKWVKKSYQKQQWALVKCPNQNHEAYWVWWNSFKRGFYCKECYYEDTNKQKWNKDDVIEFYNSYNLTICNIEDWKNVDKSVLCIDKHGFKVFASITNLKSEYGNPHPFQYNKYALENIQHYCKLYRPEYKILSEEYTGIKTKYEWEYVGINLPNDIERKFVQTADNFINGGCSHPYFSRSNGNLIFKDALTRNKIDFLKEKTFVGCKDKKMLRFDFYIPLTNEVIEIDGSQHNKVVLYFGGELGYEDRLKKDNIKNVYCKKHNIKITRIPYESNKIEEYKILVDECIKQILLTKANGKAS